MIQVSRIVLSVAFFAASLLASAQQIQVSKDNRSIAITTSDTAKADADSAQVHIGFTAYAADEKTAYATASDISNAIIESLTKNGVAKAAIQSDAQSISEQQIYQLQQMPDAERQKHRFQVTQSWTVSTSAKDAASVLNTAINNGANNSGQIDWDLKDGDTLQAEAAANALRHAQRIAEQMAKGLNATLGSLVYASNESPAPPVNGRASDAIAGIAGMEMQKVTKPLAISAQQVTRSATVYAVFALQ